MSTKRESAWIQGERQYEVTIGVRLRVPQPAHGSYVAGTPVPISCAEQTVELLESKEEHCRASVREIGEFGQCLTVRTQRLRPGEEAVALRRYRITTRTIAPIGTKADFPEPPKSRWPASFREYLGNSPGIETNDRMIQQTADQLAANLSTAWEQAFAFFEFVHAQIRYQEQPFTSARVALQNKVGDCEERTALFIALCRARRIPARSVLTPGTPGHCWAEIYLEHQTKGGLWLPVNLAGPKWFGEFPLAAVILHKGDNFRDSQSKLPPHRLLSSWYHGVEPRPQVEFILQVQPIDGDTKTKPLGNENLISPQG